MNDISFYRRRGGPYEAKIVADDGTNRWRLWVEVDDDKEDVVAEGVLLPFDGAHLYGAPADDELLRLLMNDGYTPAHPKTFRGEIVWAGRSLPFLGNPRRGGIPVLAYKAGWVDTKVIESPARGSHMTRQVRSGVGERTHAWLSDDTAALCGKPLGLAENRSFLGRLAACRECTGLVDAGATQGRPLEGPVAGSGGQG